jgi:hypothetical protein
VKVKLVAPVTEAVICPAVQAVPAQPVLLVDKQMS